MATEAATEDVKSSLSDNTLSLFTGLTVIIGILDAAFIFFLFISTYWGDIRGAIKTSEKTLLYHIIIPDSLLTFLILGLVAPTTYHDEWAHHRLITTWAGFIFVFAVLHSMMGMATICNMMALSAKTPYRYDSINNMRDLTALCMSYTFLSCCLCCLPSTEHTGYLYRSLWFLPNLSVTEGYGGIFTMVSMVLPILGTMSFSIRDLGAVRTEYSGKKIHKKIREDLSTSINFVGLCMALTFGVALPLMFPFKHYLVCFIFRVFIYLAPIFRVLMLTRMCPHFLFVISADTDDAILMEFAQLGAMW